MGFNRRKMEAQRAAAAEKEEAAKRGDRGADPRRGRRPPCRGLEWFSTREAEPSAADFYLA